MTGDRTAGPSPGSRTIESAGPESIRAAVVGAGSWGTALALLLDRNGHEVRLWSHNPHVVDEIDEHGENRSYLPGIQVPSSVSVVTDMASALEGAQVVVSVTPSQYVGEVMARAAAHLEPDALVVSASKGIEVSTLRRMDQVLADLLPTSCHDRLSVLSGPSFAIEVAEQRPTAVVAASRSREARLRTQEIFSSRNFRVYTNPDVIGVELGGAVKNVIALAAGVAAGLELGRNTQAALITRGLAEMTRLGSALGAKPSTFSGLAGMGDLVLTCTGEISRNRTVGSRLGRGEALDDILADMRAVAEGVRTAPAVLALARKEGVEMPIASQVCRMLDGEVKPRSAVEELMTRDPKPETWSS
jgi:glycerol-3-phosphate dehydrogenase (NAD(P)+)